MLVEIEQVWGYKRGGEVKPERREKRGVTGVKKGKNSGEQMDWNWSDHVLGEGEDVDEQVEVTGENKRVPCQGKKGGRKSQSLRPGGKLSRGQQIRPFTGKRRVGLTGWRRGRTKKQGAKNVVGILIEGERAIRKDLGSRGIS